LGKITGGEKRESTDGGEIGGRARQCYWSGEKQAGIALSSQNYPPDLRRGKGKVYTALSGWVERMSGSTKRLDGRRLLNSLSLKNAPSKQGRVCELGLEQVFCPQKENPPYKSKCQKAKFMKGERGGQGKVGEKKKAASIRSRNNCNSEACKEEQPFVRALANEEHRQCKG